MKKLDIVFHVQVLFWNLEYFCHDFSKFFSTIFNRLEYCITLENREIQLNLTHVIIIQNTTKL